MNRNKSIFITGLDIGSYSIKLLQLSRLNSQLKVEQYAEILLPLQPISIFEKKRRDKGRNHHVVIALPDSEVTTKLIAIESADDSVEVETQILFSLEEHIHAPLENIYFDYQLLNAEQNDKKRIFWIAAQKEKLHQRLKMLSQLEKSYGLKEKDVSVVDIESLALSRAYQQWEKEKKRDKKDKVILFNMGSKAVTLIVFSNTLPIFTHREMVKDTNSNLTETLFEICKKSLKLFFSNQGDMKIDRVVLSGGCALFPDILKKIHGHFSGAVEQVNPFISLPIAENLDQQTLNNVAPCFFQAYGLALHNLERKI